MLINYVVILYKYNYNFFIVTQVNMFYWMYAWSTMYLSKKTNDTYRVAYVVCMYACLHRVHRFNVLLEISVAYTGALRTGRDAL